MLGSGAIYPIPEADFVVDDFEIPPYFPRGYGMDVGWQKTAAIWGAHDRDSDIASEHYRGQVEPVVHAEGIRARGEWIPGLIDPAANGRSQIDGRQLLQIYRNLGLNLQMADRSTELFLVATFVVALGKALALALAVVLIVVLALAWLLVGTLHEVRASVSGVHSTLIAAVLTLLGYRRCHQQREGKYR